MSSGPRAPPAFCRPGSDFSNLGTTDLNPDPAPPPALAPARGIPSSPEPIQQVEPRMAGTWSQGPIPPFLACSGHALRSHFPFIQATLRGPKAKLAHGDALEAAGLGSGRHGQVCSGQNGLGGHFRGGWSGELSCCAGPQRLLLLQGPRGPESRPGDTHPPPREPWQVQPELPAASVFSSVCFFSEMR